MPTNVPINVVEEPDPPPGELIDLQNMTLTGGGINSQQDLRTSWGDVLISTALGINDDPQHYGKALWLRASGPTINGKGHKISWKIYEQNGGELILVPTLHKIEE